jgi:TRAP-type uncharacterized transport system substrate-binding protein
MSGGSAEGLRHQIAKRLAGEAYQHGLSFTLSPASGSRDVLDQVDAHELDVAFVQGGLDPAFHPHVRQVAALHIEPLHLLVKPTLADQVDHNLAALKGKTLNLGPEGSGTHDLARDVLKFAGLKPDEPGRPGDYTLLTKTYAELRAETDSAQLADAVFTVSALPSPVARTLVIRHHYQLVHLPFGEAFALDALNSGTAEAIHSEPQTTTLGDVSKVRIYPAQIPPFTYGVDPPTPPRAIATFGPRLLLVANENVPSRAVERVLETVFSSPFAQISEPPLTPTLLDTSPEYPLHDGAEEYRELNKPVLAGDVIDLLEKGTSLAGAILGALFFLWQWARQHLRRKRELGFESYMLKVAAIDERALALEMDARLEIKELLELQRELCRLKNEALARFAEGKLEGGEFMSGFISHVNDARNYLNRLILHERNNLEAQAANERRSAESLWNEAVAGLSVETPRAHNSTDGAPATGGQPHPSPSFADDPKPASPVVG